MRSSNARQACGLVRNAGFLLLAFISLLLQGCGGAGPEKPWLTVKLTKEFTADKFETGITTLADYLALEERLFDQLEREIVAEVPTGPAYTLVRYSRGSAADPNRWQRNWNRTFELTADAPVGGVLLLHGMSDSPYSLRALGEALNARGYRVLGLRLPGHGTAPSGLKHVTWQDMAAAVRLGMAHLFSHLGPKPVHIIGYSTGGPLALDFALEAIEGRSEPVPASLVLVSPAIRVHRASALARFKDALSALPGLGGLAYLTVMDEFDPFNYNSFATNAGAQVHAVTVNVDRRIRALAENPAAIDQFPPILTLKSTVDSTVTTEAIVDNLLKRLPAGRNELVLFDINRNAALQETLLISDPAPLTHRLMGEDSLPFAVTFVTNENARSANVVARYKAPFSLEKSDGESLGLAWPRGTVSLSHVALAFPPDDPLYGQGPPLNDTIVFLGDLAITGERGLVRLPADWLLRQRHNPFYRYLQKRVLQWLKDAGAAAERAL